MKVTWMLSPSGRSSVVKRSKRIRANSRRADGSGEESWQKALATEPRFHLRNGLLIVNGGTEEGTCRLSFPNIRHFLKGRVALDDFRIFEETLQVNLRDIPSDAGVRGLPQSMI